MHTGHHMLMGASSDDVRRRPARAAAIRRWRSITRVVALVVAAAGAVIAGNVQEAAAAESAPAPPQQGLFARSALTGDGDEWRTAMKERGIEVGLSLFQDVVVVHGGAGDSNDFPGVFDPTLSLDMERIAGWEHTQVFVRGIGTYGRDPAEAAGALNAPSNLADTVNTFKLLEAWIERGFVDETLSVRVGLYAADTEFDVKETAGVFMNGGFGTGIDLSQSGLNGPCTFPTSCFGIRVWYQPTASVFATVAVLDGVAGDPDNPRGTHIHLGGDDGALALGEFGYQRGADAGRLLRAALGVWQYTTTFDDLLETDAQGAPRRRHGTGGVYALIEGDLYREPGERRQGLSAFLRLGMADQDVNPVRYYLGAGLAGTGLLPGDEDGIVGLGFSVPINGDKYREAQRLAGTPVDRQEFAIELAYRKQIAPRMGLQFDLQYIVNPGTDPTLDDARIAGMRVNYSF